MNRQLSTDFISVPINEQYRKHFYKKFSKDYIEKRIIKDLDKTFFELFISVCVSRIELSKILNLLENLKNEIKDPIKYIKNKILFIFYTFINLSLSIILILFSKILLIDNNYLIEYKSEKMHINFKYLGFIVIAAIISIAIFLMIIIDGLYPFIFINHKIKKIKYMMQKIENKINSHYV